MYFWSVSTLQCMMHASAAMLTAQSKRQQPRQALCLHLVQPVKPQIEQRHN